jgi:hypothetical protein
MREVYFILDPARRTFGSELNRGVQEFMRRGCA